MMKASVTGSYDGDNSDAKGSVVLNAGDINFRASITGINTFVNKPSFHGVTLSVENPGSFSVNYNVPKKVLIHNYTSIQFSHYFILIKLLLCN